MAILVNLQVSNRAILIQQNSTQAIRFACVDELGGLHDASGRQFKLVVRASALRAQDDTPLVEYSEADFPGNAGGFPVEINLAKSIALPPGPYVYQAYTSFDNWVADSRLIGQGSWTVNSSLMTL